MLNVQFQALEIKWTINHYLDLGGGGNNNLKKYLYVSSLSPASSTDDLFTGWNQLPTKQVLEKKQRNENIGIG